MPSSALKHRADWDPLPSPAKVPRRAHANASVSSRKHPHKLWKPTVKHRNHPDCSVGMNFHSVSYPLTLLTYSSWHALHNRPDPNTSDRFRCPQCRKDRGTPSPHAHKLFLVAERLSWEDGCVSSLERNQNEEMNWEVNYQLGILEPAVEDPDQVPGGKNSRANEWYPYNNEFEMVAAMKLVEKAVCLTEGSWRAWVNTIDYLSSEPDESLEEGRHDIFQEPIGPLPARESLKESAVNIFPSLPSRVLKKLPEASYDVENINPFLPTPPSSSPPFPEEQKLLNASVPSLAATKEAVFDSFKNYDSPIFETQRVKGKREAAPRKRRKTTYTTLQDFYSLLDKIERKSFVGAQFLEAYAEYLRDDLCGDCWLKHSIVLDDAFAAV